MVRASLDLQPTERRLLTMAITPQPPTASIAPSGCGSKPMVLFWLVGEFTTHFRTYSSWDWVPFTETHAFFCFPDFDPWPSASRRGLRCSRDPKARQTLFSAVQSRQVEELLKALEAGSRAAGSAGRVWVHKLPVADSSI